MRWIILLFSFLLSLEALGQYFFIPYRKGNFWGYADQNGKIIIQPKYDDVETNGDNFRWQVLKNGKIGVIDQLGNEIIPLEYDSIFRRPVNSSLNEFEVYKEGKIGYFDIKGKEILPAEYVALEKCSHIFSDNQFNFLVKKRHATNWTLIDKTQKFYVDGIEDCQNYYDGIYAFKTRSGWGIYDVLNKQWKVEADFDSIGYLDNLDWKEPAEEFKKYKYFATKGDKITLITKDFESAVFENRNRLDFMVDWSHDTVGLEEDPYIEPMVLVLVTNLEFNSDSKYNLSNPRLSPKSFVQMKVEKRSYIINVTNSEGSRDLSMKFDKVKLISVGNSTYDRRVAIVSLNGKWGVYSLREDKLVVPIEFDEPKLSEQYRDIIILSKKGKVGAYMIPDNRTQFSIPTEAQYDALESVQGISPIFQSYNIFQVYFMVKDGKSCPVGYNGVKFYED
jgi:hypothetical protein